MVTRLLHSLRELNPTRVGEYIYLYSHLYIFIYIYIYIYVCVCVCVCVCMCVYVCVCVRACIVINIQCSQKFYDILLYSQEQVDFDTLNRLTSLRGKCFETMEIGCCLKLGKNRWNRTVNRLSYRLNG